MESVEILELSNDMPMLAKKTGINAVYLSKFNLALYQNSVPVLLELAMVNNSDRDLNELTLTLSSSPPFIKIKSWHIDTIVSGQKLNISDRDLQLDGALLGRLNESEVVQLSLVLMSDGESVAYYEQTIELFPRNHWSTNMLGQSLFHKADPATVVTAINPEAFFDASYDATLNTMIAYVINTEGPVREDVLAKRIARAHGWARTGKRIRDRVYLLAEAQYPSTTEEVGEFFWPEESDTSEWPAFRYSENSSRPVDEIAMQELRALATVVPHESQSADERVAVMARLVGIRRVTEEVRLRLMGYFDVV